MRALSLALAALVTACGGDRLLDERLSLALRLAASPDPVAASALVREESAAGCERLAGVLEALDLAARPISVSAALVDEALAAAKGQCPPDRARGALQGVRGGAAAVARARLAGSPEAALSALRGAPDRAVVRYRRAELLAGSDQLGDAIEEMRAALATAKDPGARALLVKWLLAKGRTEEAAESAAPLTGKSGRALRAEALAAAGREELAARLVAGAPIPERLVLARRAAGASVAPARLATSERAPPELVWAAAARIASEQGAAAALPHLERAAKALPRDADIQVDLAAARAEAGALDQALAAWDRAAALNPAARAPRLDPIAALAGAGRDEEARVRARALAEGAETARALALASEAAAAAGDPEAALALAARAREREPGDGRLAFLYARRLAAAKRPREAIEAFADLLVCGSRGRAWHRHEVAARLREAARQSGMTGEAMAALERTRPCEPAEPTDLKGYVDKLKRELGP